MRIEVVASGTTTGMPGHALSSYVVDRTIAIDAGSLGWFADLNQQRAIQHIFLTHAHLDHICGLPMFLENVYETHAAPPQLYATEATHVALREHLFNNVLMPDFVALSKVIHPFLECRTIEVGVPMLIGPHIVTAFHVEHIIPTVGYLIDDGHAAVAILTDSAPVPDMIDQLLQNSRLKAIFLEASFPSEFVELAAVSRHHTAEQFLLQRQRIPESIALYAIHVKPRFYDQIAAEIAASGLANTCVAEAGQTYEF